MVSVVTTLDGFETKSYTTNTGIALIGAGTWYSTGGTAPGTELYTGTVWIGYNAAADRRYNPAFVFENLAISPNESIASATLTLSMDRAYKNVLFEVRHYADPDTNVPSQSYLPDNQVVGSSAVVFSSSSDANVDGAGYWDQATNPIVIDIKAHLQELVNHANWTSGKSLTIVLRAYPYQNDNEVDAENNNGSYMFYAIEHSSGNPAQLDYTITATPTVTTVGGDDEILADESNVIVTGTNLSGASSLRIYKGSDSYPQTISTVSATQIQFNAAGNIPTDTGYTLEVTVDTATATRTISVINESTVTENVTEGTALTAIDGHEYVDTATGFPGTWQTQSTTGVTVYFSDGIMVGRFEDNSYKSSIKVGPVNVDNGASLYLAELNLSVFENHKYNDLRIKAVADPDAADIGTSNIISSQTLTTAQTSEANSTWSNSSATTQWVQTVNPKNIDVTAVAQEVVNHANWSSGDYIQFVIDFADLGGLQGFTRLRTNDNAGSNASTFYYAVNNGTTITSISGDDVVELGELGVTIVGFNLASASNLIISKGAISEAQTILTNTDTNITFDVSTGAIVADTGYTVSFDVDSVTYNHTVEFITGGGVNTGTGDPNLDGYEDTVTNTWFDEYSAQNVCVCGVTPFLPAETSTAVSKIGPITAQSGQSLTTGNLTWACDWGFGAFKGFTMRIYAVADPAAADVGTGNLPSAQTLTTNYLEVDTATFTGADPFGYWVPGAEVLNIAPVVEEVISHSNWVTGSYVQLVFVAHSLYSGAAGITFNSTEGGSTLLSFDYVTGAATNIASINGTNEIRTGDTNVSLLGNDLGSATALSITIGSFTESQTILTNTATEITFDFTQGQLGYGAATLSVTIGGTAYTFGLTLLPASGRDYVTVTTAGTGDNSLTYNEAPELTAGDIIDYLAVSANGFSVSVTGAGIPEIQGGSGTDTFTARAYILSTGVWYDLQTITFLPSSYFVRNTAGFLTYRTTLGTGGAIVDSDAGESWVVQDDDDSTEVWT